MKKIKAWIDIQPSFICLFVKGKQLHKVKQKEEEKKDFVLHARYKIRLKKINALSQSS